MTEQKKIEGSRPKKRQENAEKITNSMQRTEKPWNESKNPIQNKNDSERYTYASEQYEFESVMRVQCRYRKCGMDIFPSRQYHNSTLCNREDCLTLRRNVFIEQNQRKKKNNTFNHIHSIGHAQTEDSL